MTRQLLSQQTSTEFFRELVVEAMDKRRLEADHLTEYYLVNLLCQYVRLEPNSETVGAGTPLALRLGQALESGGREQRARLRHLGDFSLFTSGFFPDSLRRSVVDIDYYKSMGEYAYGSLSHDDRDAFAGVFGELARKFVRFMDVLSHISERTAMAPREVDVMRLYEKWLRTGSPRDAERLVERGLLPNGSIGKRFYQ